MEFLSSLTLLLIALKLTHITNISWVLALFPLWGQIVFYIIISIIGKIIVKSSIKKFKKGLKKDDDK